MAFELSKSEKNLARVLIDKGVDAEFKTVLEQAAVIITQWHKGCIDNRTAYHQLFKNIKEQDKRIANRYDGLTGVKVFVCSSWYLYRWADNRSLYRGFFGRGQSIFK